MLVFDFDPVVPANIGKKLTTGQETVGHLIGKNEDRVASVRHRGVFIALRRRSPLQEPADALEFRAAGIGESWGRRALSVIRLDHRRNEPNVRPGIQNRPHPIQGELIIQRNIIVGDEDVRFLGLGDDGVPAGGQPRIIGPLNDDVPRLAHILVLGELAIILPPGVIADIEAEGDGQVLLEGGDRPE